MTAYGNTLADFYHSATEAAKAKFATVAQLGADAVERVEQGAGALKKGAMGAGRYAATAWKAGHEKVRQKIVHARQAVDKKLRPQPAGAVIQRCPQNKKAERVAERMAKIAGSKERLKQMSPGKERDALEHATKRFERNNVAVERARIANDTYNVGQGDPPEGWERVSVEELRKMGMEKESFPQLSKDFRPSEYKDGYYPELYRTKPDVFGEVRYVLAFRGTQGIKDGSADVVQAFGGETDQYTRAIKTAQQLKKMVGDKLDITGHSMGGGMAVAAGIVTGSPVYAIDPAGVHPATLERAGKHYTRDAASRYVQNYVAEGEILDTVQRPASQRALLAGITSVSSVGGFAIATAGRRAMIENGTVTYDAPGPIYKTKILLNASDVVEGRTEQGIFPGLAGRVNNMINPIEKINLHDPVYVIAGLEQQKADDLCVMERGCR